MNSNENYDEGRVEIFGNTSSDYFSMLRNKETGKYYAPPCGNEFEMLKQDSTPGSSNPDQMSHMAIFDTGLMFEHPNIKECSVESADFTGEGPEDLNGHGTIVALIAINPLLASGLNVNLLNIKILDKSGYGDEKWLIDGLDWCAKWATENNTMVIANISAGIYHKRLGILECNGKCRVSQAAKRAADANVFLCIAAGNEGPERSACPQKAAMQKMFPAMVVGSVNSAGTGATDYSGPSTILAPEPFGPWQEVK